MLPSLQKWSNKHDPDRQIDTIATKATQAHKSITVNVGHKSRPLRDGGGKPSPGRLHPSQRRHPLRHLGALLALGTVARTSTFQDDLQGPTSDMADGLCTAYPHEALGKRQACIHHRTAL
jgi:hypothetical protein